MSQLETLDAWYLSLLFEVDRPYAKPTRLRKKYGPILSIEQVEAKQQDKKLWKRYRIVVDELTRLQPLHILDDIDLRDGHNYQLDHIISAKDGFRYNIPPEMIANMSNLRVISREENTRKGARSDVFLLKDMLNHPLFYVFDRNRLSHGWYLKKYMETGSFPNLNQQKPLPQWSKYKPLLVAT